MNLNVFLQAWCSYLKKQKKTSSCNRFTARSPPNVTSSPPFLFMFLKYHKFKKNKIIPLPKFV